MKWQSQAPWLVASRVVIALGQVGLLLGITRLAGTDEARSFVLSLAICAPVFMFVDMGLRNLYLTLTPPVAWATFQRVRLLTASVGLLVAVAVSLLADVDIAIAVVVAATKAVELMLDLSYGAMQGRDKVRGIFFVSAINVVGTLALALPMLYGGFGAAQALAASLSMSAMCLFAVRRWLLKKMQSHTDPPIHAASRPAWRLVRSGASVGAAMSLASITVYLPQYLLGALGSASDLLVYAFVAYAVTGAQILMNGVAQALLGSLRGRLEARGHRIVVQESRALARRLTLGALGLGALVVLVGPHVVPWLMGERFRITVFEIVPIALTIGLVPILLVGSAVLFALNGFRLLVISNASAALSAAVIGWVLVDTWGLMGALLTAAVALGVRAVGMWGGIARMAMR